MLKGFHLTLLMGPTIAVPVPQRVTEAVTKIQVTTSVGQRSGFQLTFAFSKESLLTKVLLPAGFFDPKIRVIIIGTLGGIPNVLMDGVVTRQEVSPSNEPGQSTLTITGEDVSLLMDLDHTRACWPAMPDDVRVRLIILKYLIYGLIPAVIPPLFTDLPIPTERIPIQSDTDLNYINKLARDNGYTFFIDPGPAPGTNIAYWGPEVRVGPIQPALNVNMDSHTNVESLSFSFDGLSRKQLTIEIQEPTTKIGISIPVPNISLLAPPLALKQAPALRTEPLKDVAKLNPIKAMGLGLAAALQSSEAVSGSGSLDVLRYGRPLKARHLVGVRGAGQAYDGLYFVKSVTHNLQRGEYKQSFTLARNGLIPLTPKVIP